MSNTLSAGTTSNGILLPISGAPGNWVGSNTPGATLNGTSGNDAVYSPAGGALLLGGAGDDTYDIWDARDRVVESAGGGTDTVISHAPHYYLPDQVENMQVVADGGIGMGNALNNLIMGGTGSQTLDGGAGNDVLTGGTGPTTFEITAGNGSDAITNFRTGTDVVALDGYGLASFGAVQSALVQQGSDTALNLGNGETLLFRNHAPSDFSAHDVRLDLSAMHGTFADEFNSFNTGTWQTTLPWGGRTLASNHETEYYTDSGNISAANGTLNITATPSGGLPDGLTYSSGLISSYASFSQTYGYFEMKASLPAGAGMWPAFWLLPEDKSWPPELDAMEMLGNEPGKVYLTSHSGTTGADVSHGFPTVLSSDSTNPHTYAVSWRPDYVRWYIDGAEVASTPTPADMNKPMYLLANLAVGGTGSWPGAAAGESGTMHIDYIHAYQFNDIAPAPAGGTPPPNSYPAVSTTLGSGADSLVLKLSQDVYNGSAQYTVKVDGVQQGGTLTASALHGSGQQDTVTINGSFGSGVHSVAVTFLNDAWGGTATTDRNLYLDGTSLDGATVANGSAALLSAGTANVAFGSVAAGTTIGSGADSLVVKISQDAYLGNAQYTLGIDGVQQGGTLTAGATHGSGDDLVTLKGSFSGGAHVLAVNFLNDAWGGTAGTDRNLYVDGVSLNGTALANGTASLLSAGPVGIALGGSSIGSGADGLVLKISQDAWNGSAQYMVKVDGVQIGGTQTAGASHAAGQDDVLTVKGSWAAGDHTVTVNFLNDAYGGTAATDRNLYVDGISHGGAFLANGSAALLSAGPHDFAWHL